MDLNEIKRLVREFHRVDYKNLFGALITYETEDYLNNIDDLNKGDIEYLEGLFDFYMESDINLFNIEELQENYEMER